MTTLTGEAIRLMTCLTLIQGIGEIHSSMKRTLTREIFVRMSHIMNINRDTKVPMLPDRTLIGKDTPDRDQPNTQRGPNNQVPLHSRGSVRPNVLPQHDKLFLDSPAHGTPRLNQPYANTDRRNRDPFGPDPYYENSSPQHMAPIQGPAHPQYSGRSHPPPRRIENNNGLRPFSEQIPNRVEGGLNQDQGRRSESQIIDKRTGKQFSKENSNVQYLLRNNSRTKSSIRGSGVTRPANVTGQTTQGRPEDNRGHARVSQGQTNDDSKTRNTAVKGIMSGRRSDLERETAQKKTVEFQDGNKQINSDLKIVEPIDQTKNDSGKTKQEGIGSKTGYEFPDVDDLDDVNLEDVEGVYEGKDIYMCYLKTEQGALVGPLRFDIEDISIGLPDTESSEDKLETQEGMKYRQTGSHGLNETSSRSHSMMTLAIDSELQDPEDENLYITKRGKLTFVDLAGSEKVKDSHSTAETLIESNNINRSLLVLGNCISCLGDHRKRGGHVPYRDSKLTKLLADSLGGSGVTLMIACITPSSHHISETMNTLRYASRAKKIRTKPLIKMDPREKLIMSLKREIKILRNENQYLRQQLEFPEKTKAAMQNESDEKYKKFLKDQENNKSSDQPKKDPKSEEAGLYEMLQEYMIENEALRTENADLHATKDKIRREQQLLYKDNEKMMKRIEDLERLIGPTAWRRPPIDPYSQPSSNAPSQVQSPRQSPALQYRSPQPSGQPFPIGQQGRYPSQEQYAVAPSPNGTARGKGPPPPPPPNNSKPRRPPHRLAEPIMRPAQIPPDHQNGGPAYDHPPPSMPQQHMANGPIRQGSWESSGSGTKSYMYIHTKRNQMKEWNRTKNASLPELRLFQSTDMSPR
ncbi:kinesin-like protein KIN-14R isoform X4 [Pecten maximus]|uniref:kinesin-like protein KIN-14R isoform X4 n=1 Tax=Pecten maximus TaxID=6579 RepID=UPI0014584880|nr:kinesin-like protein KIN-14R isoform X4 [Pecten maximus]